MSNAPTCFCDLSEPTAVAYGPACGACCVAALDLRESSYPGLAAIGGSRREELRAAVVSRQRFEDAYQFLGEHPPLRLAVQRHGDELRLVTAPEVSSSVEGAPSDPRPVALSSAALEVLPIVAYSQQIARSGIELIRGSASDSAWAPCSSAG